MLSSFLPAFYCHNVYFPLLESLPNSANKSFSCSLKFVVRLGLEAILQRHNRYLEMCIRSNSADNAFPRETWFSN